MLFELLQTVPVNVSVLFICNVQRGSHCSERRSALTKAALAKVAQIKAALTPKVLTKAALTKTADIVVAALGIPEFLTADMIKEDAVVIDVGITRVSDDSKKRGYRIAGDVHFESVSKKASYITPVPGGVGPMTIAMLLKNTLLARQRAEAD